jgi:predicted TIM-barrel fold metal-dependent hydrolase
MECQISRITRILHDIFETLGIRLRNYGQKSRQQRLGGARHQRHGLGPAIMFCREVLGADRVMYAMDYPYEYTPGEVTAQDALPVDAAAKKAFFQGIAEQVFGLT